MKKFKLTRFLVVALVAIMVVGSSVLSTFAANDTVSGTTIENQKLLADAKAKYNTADEATNAKIDALIKEAVDSLEGADGVVEPEKSTFIDFIPTPVKVVKYDGEPHGLKARVYTTLGGEYVADTTNLYIGVMENGEIYYSFEEPTEVGYYNVVAMYSGSEDYYPIHAYGILVILPACDPDVPDTDDPGTDEPGTDEPGKDEPGTDDPGKDEPGTDDPGKDEPGTDDPGTDDPGKDEPGTDDPGTDEPGTDDPGKDEPGTDEPGTDDPGTDDPETDKPVVNEPTDSKPEAPKTGDSVNFMTYVVLGAVAIVAIGAVVVNKKRA